MLVAQQLKLDLTQGIYFARLPLKALFYTHRLVLLPQRHASKSICNRWGVTVEKHCMASVRDVQSLWPSLGLNYRRLWIMWDGLVAIQFFITYSWLRFLIPRGVGQASGGKCSFRYFRVGRLEQFKAFCVCFPGRFIHETPSEGLLLFCYSQHSRTKREI